MIEPIVPDWPAPPNVRSLVTTRKGGASGGAYGGFNLGDHVGDDPDAVAENRSALRLVLPGEPRWLVQVHGAQVVRADEAAHGTVADGAWTRKALVPCAILTADCLPVLLCDDAGAVVGAAHAGWRGLAGGVVERTVEAMQADPASLLAYLGPAIGPQAFEVGREVLDAFGRRPGTADAAFNPRGKDKWLANIYDLAREKLRGCGVTRVFGGGFCTVSDRETFFSYRRDGMTGRMASLIWLAA